MISMDGMFSIEIEIEIGMGIESGIEVTMQQQSDNPLHLYLVQNRRVKVKSEPVQNQRLCLVPRRRLRAVEGGSHGVNPLLSTVSRALRGVGEVGGGCGRPAPPVTPPPSSLTTTERYDDGSKTTSTARPPPSIAPIVAETTSRITTVRSTTSGWQSSTSGWDDYKWSSNPDDYEYEYSGQWADNSHKSSTPR